MTVADRIRGESTKRHISTRDWAKLFKVTERTWQYWLKDSENISIGRLRVIAARLDTTPAELMGEIE
jgi:transcriptional regulator with XRE-family HTH domain